MQEFIVKVSMSDRVKKPSVVLDQIFNGDSYLIEECEKHIQWSELLTEDMKVIATNIVIDWGM